MREQSKYMKKNRVGIWESNGEYMREYGVYPGKN